jgi:hypothetical protein
MTETYLEDWVHDNPRKAYLLMEKMRNALSGLVDLDDGDQSFAWDHAEEFDAGRQALEALYNEIKNFGVAD